jgi:hypothetical protein
MRIVKPCRPSAAIDLHGGPRRLIMGEERRERTPASPDRGPRTGHTRSASVAWDNRLTATGAVRECRNPVHAGRSAFLARPDRQPDRKRITRKNRPPTRPDVLMSGIKPAETSIAVSELPHTSSNQLVITVLVDRPRPGGGRKRVI